jgi:hypothetical protein
MMVRELLRVRSQFISLVGQFGLIYETLLTTLYNKWILLVMSYRSICCM